MMLSHCEFFPNEAAVRLLCPKTKVFIGFVIKILQSVLRIGPLGYLVANLAQGNFVRAKYKFIPLLLSTVFSVFPK